jgi:Secretion system C-terminal sorting domain
VKPYSSNTAIWDVQCKRTITNTAWVGYKTATSGTLFAKSNGNDCGIGTETKILVQDPLFNSTIDSTLIPTTGEIDPCAYKTDDVITRLRNELVTRGFETAATVNSLDLRNGKFQKLSFDTTFANISSVKFYAIKDYSGTQSGKCQKAYVFKYKSCTTPVNLISFSAELTDEGAFLNWLVSSNKDISHIEIQRSFDGKEFVALKSVKYQTVSTRYSFYDNTAETGNVYYRLKIVENSGEVVFSNVESVKRTDDLSLEVFPNPFDHTTSVSIISKADLSFDMKIMDLSGKLIYVAASQMSNNKIVLGDGLKSGTYILEINLEDNKLVRKVVKY